LVRYLELPAGQIGEIAVQGSVVTLEYFNRPDATRLAKIIDPTGGSYHRMAMLATSTKSAASGSAAEKSQRVRMPDGDLFSMPVEGIFNTHPPLSFRARRRKPAPASLNRSSASNSCPVCRKISMN